MISSNLPKKTPQGSERAMPPDSPFTATSWRRPPQQPWVSGPPWRAKLPSPTSPPRYERDQCRQIPKSGLILQRTINSESRVRLTASPPCIRMMLSGSDTNHANEAQASSPTD